MGSVPSVDLEKRKMLKEWENGLYYPRPLAPCQLLEVTGIIFCALHFSFSVDSLPVMTSAHAQMLMTVQCLLCRHTAVFLRTVCPLVKDSPCASSHGDGWASHAPERTCKTD